MLCGKCITTKQKNRCRMKHKHKVNDVVTTKTYTETSHKDKHIRHRYEPGKKSACKKYYVENEPRHSDRQAKICTWRQYYVVHDIFKDKNMETKLCGKCTTTQLPTAKKITWRQ